MDRLEIKDAFVDFLRSNGYHKEDLIERYEQIIDEFSDIYSDQFDPELFETVLDELRSKIAVGVEKQIHKDGRKEYEKGNRRGGLSAAAREDERDLSYDDIRPSREYRDDDGWRDRIDEGDIDDDYIL